jgi:hypothetical protein
MANNWENDILAQVEQSCRAGRLSMAESLLYRSDFKAAGTSEFQSVFVKREIIRKESQRKPST